jgi:hypothetical protein
VGTSTGLVVEAILNVNHRWSMVIRAFTNEIALGSILLGVFRIHTSSASRVRHFGAATATATAATVSRKARHGEADILLLLWWERRDVSTRLFVWVLRANLKFSNYQNILFVVD